MAGSGADIWVCGQCRSVNNLRAKQCYNCRTPQHLAAVDPAAIEGTGHGQLREIPLPEFHGSRGEAILASALIGLVIVMQIVSTVASGSAVVGLLGNPDALNDLGSDEFQAVMSAGFIGLATIGVAILALAAWAYWLSRAVVAMPALGLGYPPTNGLMAFVENFIPGLNLFRVPAIVRDMNRRLDPDNGRGEALIFAAWVGLFGGWLLPRVLGFLNAFGADTLETAVRNAIIFQGIATGLVIVGAMLLIVLIWWIEERIARRRAAQLGRRGGASVGRRGSIRRRSCDRGRGHDRDRSPARLCKPTTRATSSLRSRRAGPGNTARIGTTLRPDTGHGRIQGRIEWWPGRRAARRHVDDLGPGYVSEPPDHGGHRRVGPAGS